MYKLYILKNKICGFVDKKSMLAKRNGYSFSYREVNFFRSSVDLLFQEVEEAAKAKKTIMILTGSKENSKKLKQMLQENVREDVASAQNIIISDRKFICRF